MEENEALAAIRFTRMLQRAIRQFPDLRVGQIIANATTLDKVELFYMSDERLANCLGEYLKRNGE